jgi:hypothetical protein
VAFGGHDSAFGRNNAFHHGVILRQGNWKTGRFGREAVRNRFATIRLDESFFKNDSGSECRGLERVQIQGDQRKEEPWPSDVPNQFSLGAGVAVDISLGRLDGSMACEQLHVAQAASRAVNVAGGHGNEAPSPGMR